MNTARKCALLFERRDDSGLRPGEWRHCIGGGIRVACPACGALDEPEDVSRLWTCPDQGCTVAVWIELAVARGSTR